MVSKLEEEEIITTINSDNTVTAAPLMLKPDLKDQSAFVSPNDVDVDFGNKAEYGEGS